MQKKILLTVVVGAGCLAVIPLFILLATHVIAFVDHFPACLHYSEFNKVADSTIVKLMDGDSTWIAAHTIPRYPVDAPRSQSELFSKFRDSKLVGQRRYVCGVADSSPDCCAVTLTFDKKTSWTNLETYDFLGTTRCDTVVGSWSEYLLTFAYLNRHWRIYQGQPNADIVTKPWQPMRGRK